MPLKNSKIALYGDNAPNKCLKQASNQVKEEDDFIKSFSVDQDKLFQLLSKLRTWLFLTRTLHLNMVYFTCDAYF